MTTETKLKALFDLRRATLAARQRTGDTAIGSRTISSRLVQLVRFEHSRRATKITELSGPVTVAEAVALLDGMK